MKKKFLKGLLFLLPVLIIAAADQLTKRWAVSALMGKPDIPVIPGVLEFTYVENTGMAFGLLEDGTIFFYIATFVALAVILFFFSRIPFKKRYVPMLLLLSFVAGGAVGNFIDRLLLKYVVDFIYISLIRFPVFNVADIFVSLSCIAILALLIFFYKGDDFNDLWPFRKKEQMGS